MPAPDTPVVVPLVVAFAAGGLTAVAGLGWVGWRLAGGWGLALGVGLGAGLAVLGLPALLVLLVMCHDDR